MEKLYHRPYLLLIIIGFIVFLPSLFGKFLWDDEDFVYANTYVENFRLDKLFTDSITSGRGKISNYYRPLQGTVYAFVHLLFGFRPFYYHLVSVGFHLTAAVMIYFFFVALSKRKLAPFLIALIFLVHPVQTEAVSYISGLSDSLYVLFGFGSLYLFLQKRLKWSLFVFLLCLLSKEIGLVFVGLIFLLWFFQKKHRFVDLIPYLAITLIYLLFHFTYINHLDVKANWGSGPYASSIIIRLATFIKNLFLYVSLMVFPKELFMERDYSITIPESIFNPYTLIFIIINSVILYFLNRRRRQKNFQLLLFAYLGFFGSFLPVSGLVLVNGIFYEHFLYLPLVFFFSFFLFLIPRVNRLVLVVVSVLIFAFSVRNLARQLDWIDPVRFYRQTLVRAPQSVRVGNGLAMALSERGEFAAATAEYQKLIETNPNIPNFYHNLARTEIDEGLYLEAESHFLEAIKVDPNFYYSYFDLLSLYQNQGEASKAASLSALIETKFGH